MATTPHSSLNLSTPLGIIALATGVQARTHAVRQPPGRAAIPLSATPLGILALATGVQTRTASALLQNGRHQPLFCFHVQRPLQRACPRVAQLRHAGRDRQPAVNAYLYVFGDRDPKRVRGHAAFYRYLLDSP